MALNTALTNKKIIELEKVHNIEIIDIVEGLNLRVSVEIPHYGFVFKGNLDQLMVAAEF